MFAQILVPLPLAPLTYKIPPGLSLSLGTAVLVPFRRKFIEGVVYALKDTPDIDASVQIKEIKCPINTFPHIHEDALKLIQWASKYYHYPEGEVLRTMLPPKLEPSKSIHWRMSKLAVDKKNCEVDWPKGPAKKRLLQKFFTGDCRPEGTEVSVAKQLEKLGWLEKYAQDIEFPPQVVRATAPNLNIHQASALQKINAAIDANIFHPFLLQGITGSGKTEIYLRAAEHCLDSGKSVLLVVPEIALTPQLVYRFQTRLSEPIALLHSGVSDGERSKYWHGLNSGKLRLCIGARSASLAPIKNLGLVIVDEEHESALKQEDHLKYSARDLSVVRAKFSQCSIVLGSATPSMESFFQAKKGKYQLLELPERASGASLPEVIVVDQTKLTPTVGAITPDLQRNMNLALQSGGQVMLLLNRKGYSSFLVCKTCGHVPQCPNCSVSLTKYVNNPALKCHYCGHSDSTPSKCPVCHQSELSHGTLGTEALEEEVLNKFPDYPAIRIDRESTERKGSLENALLQIHQGTAKIIIGTQMIAKGHDFPNVTLVGVVNADSSFHLPDFRASERSFQLFTQMAGRAGRGQKPGKVVIQTYNPNHPSIRFATKHDVNGFAQEELQLRHSFSYPPFCRMARLLYSHQDSRTAEIFLEKISSLLVKPIWKSKIDLIGPAPAALTKIQNKYRWHLILKSQNHSNLQLALSYIQSLNLDSKDRRGIMQIDVDPLSLM